MADVLTSAINVLVNFKAKARQKEHKFPCLRKCFDVSNNSKMTQPTLIKLTVLTLLLNLGPNITWCQSVSEYVDSIKQYQVYVDSLIFSYSSNPASPVRHGIIHYNCIDSTGEDKGYGSGGSAEIYFDPEAKKIFNILYIKGCDIITAERTLYLVNNKIVLAIISVNDNKTTIYFRNDKRLKNDRANELTESFADSVLKDGYKILKDFK